MFVRRVLSIASLYVVLIASAHAAPCAGFSDVEDTSPFCANVTYLKNRLITLGCLPGLYCPNDPVSRLAMAAFLNRLGDSLFPLTCGSGQIMKWNGADWTCANDIVGTGSGGGTVTSVAAGTGLSGSPNPITGAGSLNLAPAFQLPQGCAANQIPKWNGTAWICAADVGGGTGSVTQVDTGTGLTGGPITTTGTVAIAAGGVGTTQLANGAVNASKIADGAVATAKIQDAAVTAAKIAPGAIGNSALGTGIASARPPHAERNIDIAGTGRFSSIIVGADGLPLIAYYAQASGDLKVAHCETVDCASTTITTIDSAGDVGQYVTAVVQTNGLPAIAYYDLSNTSLKIAFCDNVRCTSATFATVDATNDVGKYASMTLNESGFLRISYFDETLDDLKFASCGQFPCSSAAPWTVSTPVSAGNVGRGTAITVSFANQALIAYYDATLSAVRLARCTTLLCDAPVLVTVKAISAGRVAEAFGMTLNHGGAPVISFVDRVAGGSGSLNVAVCESLDCAAPTIAIGGSTNLELGSTGVTVTADNLPIAIGGSSAVGGNCDASNSSSASGTLVKCLNAQCSSTAENNPTFAAGGSMTLNSTGYPIYSYQRCGLSGAQLNVGHCATMACLGQIRPR